MKHRLKMFERALESTTETHTSLSDKNENEREILAKIIKDDRHMYATKVLALQEEMSSCRELVSQSKAHQSVCVSELRKLTRALNKLKKERASCCMNHDS